MRRAAERFGLSSTQHRVLRLMAGYPDGEGAEESIRVTTLRALRSRRLIENRNHVLPFTVDEPPVPLGAKWHAYQLTRDGAYLAASMGKWTAIERSAVVDEPTRPPF